MIYKYTRGHSGYIGKAVEPEYRRGAIGKAVQRLELERDLFDAVAFMGMSGALFAPSVADALNVPFILVRKPDDNHHGAHGVETSFGLDGTRAVFVDDFVGSGRTFRAVRDALREIGVEITCAYLYNEDSFYTEDDFPTHWR